MAEPKFSIERIEIVSFPRYVGQQNGWAVARTPIIIDCFRNELVEGKLYPHFYRVSIERDGDLERILSAFFGDYGGRGAAYHALVARIDRELNKPVPPIEGT